MGVATRRAKESGRGAKAGPSKAESPRAADPPGRTAAPAKQSSMPPPVGKAKSKVQKTYGRKQNTVQLPEALDVFGGLWRVAVAARWRRTQTVEAPMDQRSRHCGPTGRPLCELRVARRGHTGPGTFRLGDSVLQCTVRSRAWGASAAVCSVNDA